MKLLHYDVLKREASGRGIELSTNAVVLLEGQLCTLLHQPRSIRGSDIESDPKLQVVNKDTLKPLLTGCPSDYIHKMEKFGNQLVERILTIACKFNILTKQKIRCMVMHHIIQVSIDNWYKNCRDCGIETEKENKFSCDISVIERILENMKRSD